MAIRSTALSLAFLLSLSGCGKDSGPNNGDTGVPTGSPTATGTGTGTGSTTSVSTTAPVAADDQFNATEGGFVAMQLTANDTDPNDLVDATTLTIVTQPAHGTVDVRPDGGSRYVHDGSEDSSDVFTYTVQDVTGELSNVATVTLTIDPVNDPPVAVDDAGNATEGQVAVLDLAVNDTDADDGIDPGSIVLISDPLHGTVTVNANGTVDYTHDGSEESSDEFGYRISDPSGALSNGALVTVTIAGVNDAPTARDDLIGVVPGGAVQRSLSQNDLDPDDGIDVTTIAIATLPAFGTLTVNGDGTVTYTHDGGLATDDIFTYTIDDLAGATSNVATVNVIIGDNVCNPDSQIFAHTGAPEVFVAPCTGSFTLEAWGAQGNGGNGGNGGYAAGVMDLTVGEQITISVGGMDGFNGGGAGWAVDVRDGGGASDVRIGGNLLADRVLVAGGGGSSSGDSNFRGGDGGGGVCGVNYCGGGGADGYGGPGTDGGLNGGVGDVSCHAGGAGGGGLNSGGIGSGNTCYTNTFGMDGTLGFGGDGDPWETGICYDYYGGTSGGGGGYYGGGGTSVGNCGGGGGGGGSSWTGTLALPVMTPGVRTGDGEVILSWL